LGISYLQHQMSVSTGSHAALCRGLNSALQIIYSTVDQHEADASVCVAVMHTYGL